MNFQNSRLLHGHSLILVLNQAFIFPIDQLHESGLGIPSLPINVPQRCRSKSAFVRGEEPAFFVQRDRTGGQLEGDVRGGGEAEPVGLVVGGGARDLGLVVAVEHGHVGGGFVVPVDGVEEGRVVGVEDFPLAASVVHVEGSEGFGVAEHGGFRMAGEIGVCGPFGIVGWEFLRISDGLHRR